MRILALDSSGLVASVAVVEKDGEETSTIAEYTVNYKKTHSQTLLPMLDELVKNGQVATQYVDLDGQPTMDQRYNPNGSLLAIEGITSPDGRVFGKMGHSERSGEYLYKNVTGDKYQPIFEGGVDYFKI